MFGGAVVPAYVFRFQAFDLEQPWTFCGVEVSSFEVAPFSQTGGLFFSWILRMISRYNA